MEALHRRKIPRVLAVVMIVLGLLVVLGLGGYLLFPVLADQASHLASALPDAMLQLVEQAWERAYRMGLRIGGGEGISPSTLASLGRKLLGGLLGSLVARSPSSSVWWSSSSCPSI